MVNSPKIISQGTKEAIGNVTEYAEQLNSQIQGLTGRITGATTKEVNQNTSKETKSSLFSRISSEASKLFNLSKPVQQTPNAQETINNTDTQVLGKRKRELTPEIQEQAIKQARTFADSVKRGDSIVNPQVRAANSQNKEESKGRSA